ncbi:uncharacterized protein LOC114440386 [Parambassis ranga]|uniref:THAP domain-containing protein 1 n=1 Tax=Parambassis ranga TaxID=210632 RepID=A0A6P7IXN6_9TELE|nr:uncharacterized protein LOC114440386 [Parambassis ranga]
MGRHKCAYKCENTSDPNVKFFRFPLYNHRLKKWLINMKWQDWTPTRFSVLCSNHFEEQYIDRRGKYVALKKDAVPTIFPTTDKAQRKASIKPGPKIHKASAAKTPKKDSPQSATTTPTTAAKHSTQHTEPSQAVQVKPRIRKQKKCDRWRVIVDEGLMKIDSFPNFFHGDYCVPQSIYWVPDDKFNTKDKDPENMIEVNEPWQWLGLDVRGPLPQTVNGHKYILTLTDYYSKWVEAAPMESCDPSCVATNIMDIIAHFGYPLGILSRLPQEIVHKINRELKDKLKVTSTLVIHHQHTGMADITTPQLIDRMVGDLIEQHAADWDVYLPAKVFSLCFKEHSETKERPFSLLCCNGAEPVQSPREVTHSYSKIQERRFVIR